MCCTPPQGFRLQDPEVEDVIHTAKELEGGCVEPDTSLSAEENVELLLRATRLLQLGLEVQYAEGNTLLAENNELRGNLRVRCVLCVCVQQPATPAAAGAHAGVVCASALGIQGPGRPAPLCVRLLAATCLPDRRSWRTPTGGWRQRLVSCGSCATSRRCPAT